MFRYDGLEAELMHFVDQLVHTTIRIETDGPNGKGSGTGFFLNLRHESYDDGKTAAVPVIVTNKHVVQGAARATFQFTKAVTATAPYEPEIGSIVAHTVTSADGQWYFHPNEDVDLCIFPFGSIIEKSEAKGEPIFFRSFRVDDIASSEFMRSLAAIEDVLMIGYPSGLWDSAHNFPITRRGVTATPPAFGFEGRQQFVIDCACFPGSSGSPVLLYNPTNYLDKSTGAMTMGGRIMLLGVLWGGPQFDSIGEIKVLPVPTTNQPIAHSKIPMNLGFCIRASELLWFEDQFRMGSSNGQSNETRPS